MSECKSQEETDKEQLAFEEQQWKDYQEQLKEQGLRWLDDFMEDLKKEKEQEWKEELAYREFMKEEEARREKLKKESKKESK